MLPPGIEPPPLRLQPAVRQDDVEVKQHEGDSDPVLITAVTNTHTHTHRHRHTHTRARARALRWMMAPGGGEAGWE